MEIKPIGFDTGIAFTFEGHTIIVHKKDMTFSIYNFVMSDDDIKNALEPMVIYGDWGSAEGMKRKVFFDTAKEALSREDYLELIERHGVATRVEAEQADQNQRGGQTK